MSYPRQDSVVRNLQEESLRALDAIQMNHWRQIETIWRMTRSHMRMHITETYHQFFQNDKWSLVGLKSSGAWHVLAEGLRSMTAQFRDVSRQKAKDSVNELYRQSILRHAWIIDQATPPNVRVRIPHKKKLFESRRQVEFYKGDEAVSKFAERWNSWNDGYYSSLMNNLQLGALNESSASDAADEVDATRVNTPAFGIMDALQRLFDFETVAAMNQAVYAVSDANDEADVQMVWATRRDLKVCDDCDENEGLPEEEADGEIPLHPNCHCYWRMVPKSWAELLRSGDPNAYDTAVLMDARGLVPNAMVIQDEAGQLAGYSTVTFKDWHEHNFNALVGQ